MRIEVGYGLEGALPDAIAANIIQTRILPAFKRGDMVAGILAGSQGIMQALAGEYQPVDNTSKADKQGGPWLFILVVIAMIVLHNLRGGGGGPEDVAGPPTWPVDSVPALWRPHWRWWWRFQWWRRQLWRRRCIWRLVIGKKRQQDDFETVFPHLAGQGSTGRAGHGCRTGHRAGPGQRWLSLYSDPVGRPARHAHPLLVFQLGFWLGWYEILLVQWSVWLLLSLLFHWTPIKMRLIPNKVRRHRAALMARLQFVEQGLHRTRDRLGVLIFVSVAEHYVEILVDDGIAQHIDNTQWQQIIDDFVVRVRNKEVEQGFLECVERTSAILTDAFPQPGIRTSCLTA